jgi:hypothetical protein
MKSKLALILIATLAALTACSVSEQKGANGEKKVEVKVPFTSIKVATDTDAKDTGLSAYPGARAKVDEGDNDKNRANVQIGGENFGVKVVVATYLSDDPPEKVIDFYRKDLKKFGGAVLECPKGLTESHGGDHEKEIRCSDSGNSQPGKLDLAVGIPARQHVVSVKPSGKGTEFSLVYVNVKGGDKETM